MARRPHQAGHIVVIDTATNTVERLSIPAPSCRKSSRSLLTAARSMPRVSVLGLVGEQLHRRGSTPPTNHGRPINIDGLRHDDRQAPRKTGVRPTVTRTMYRSSSVGQGKFSSSTPTHNTEVDDIMLARAFPGSRSAPTAPAHGTDTRKSWSRYWRHHGNSEITRSSTPSTTPACWATSDTPTTARPPTTGESTPKQRLPPVLAQVSGNTAEPSRRYQLTPASQTATAPSRTAERTPTMSTVTPFLTE